IADAYLTLAQIVATMSFAETLPKTKAYAAKALALDPDGAEAHGSMAAALLWVEHDWRRAEEHARRAVERNPNDAYGHLILGVIVGSQGRFDEGIANLRRAIELDPLSLISHYSYTWQLFEARHDAAALAEADRTLAVEPHFEPTLLLKAR